MKAVTMKRVERKGWKQELRCRIIKYASAEIHIYTRIHYTRQPPRFSLSPLLRVATVRGQCLGETLPYPLGGTRAETEATLPRLL